MNTATSHATAISHAANPQGVKAEPQRGQAGRKVSRRDGFRAWAARRPVLTLLIPLFSIGYPVMALPILADHGVIPSGWMPQVAGLDAERIASVLLVFVALLPSVMWVTWAVDGPAGVRVLVRRMFRWRIGAGWWLLVLAALPTLTLTFALLLGDPLKSVDVAPFALTQIVGLLVNLVLINLWEETAWAGFVQTRLERRHSLVAAAILTAIPFALIHMPLHFIGDFTVGSLTAALVTLLIVCAVVRLMIGVVLRGTGGSILAVAMLHTAFNRSNNGDGVVAGLVPGQARGLAGLLAVIVLTAAVAIIARRRMGRAHNRTHDGGTVSRLVDVSDGPAGDLAGTTARPPSGTPTAAPSAASHAHPVALD